MTPPSTAARLARQAARLDVAMTTVISQLTTAVPRLSTTEAHAVLAAAVPIPVRGAARFLEELAAHLAAHPDALTSGDSHCPPVLLRLTHILHDAGHPVVRPGCARCGTVVIALRQLRPDGRVCGPCDARSRRGTCARCGRTETRIVARRPEGGICNPCYRVDPQVVEECSGCGRARSPAVRLPDGGSLCRGCWKRPLHQCVCCGQMKAAALVDGEGAFCHLCYNRFRRPRRICGRCGKLSLIARNATGDQPDLCHGCYRGPESACSGCGRTRACRRVQQGTPICAACYARQRPRESCYRCQRERPINARWPIGPVCLTCYTAVVRAPAECGRCRTVQPLVGRADDGVAICGPCAGVNLDFTCRQCGRTGNPYGHGQCAHCVLADRIHGLLASPDGAVPAQLRPLAEALTQVEAPFSAIRWISYSPNARLLARLAAKGRPLSHELLDELPPGHNQRYIRQVLVHTGVLVERHEDLEGLPSWLEHHLADRPTEHATLVRPFLHWFLLRRARNRAAARRYPASASRDLRRRVIVALDLLAWLDEHDLSLADLTQDHVDTWLAAGNTPRYLIRYFLNWTSARGLTRTLTVPTLPRRQPADLLDEQARQNLLRQCLTDDTMPVDVRAAGALTLLFGLPAERLRHLTANQLDHRDGDTYLTVGTHPLLLPPRLADLLRSLADRPHPRPLLAHRQQGPPWLFPGMVPGQPIAGRAFTARLVRNGIPVRTARNGATAALAADLPAAILADLLGMHIHTAVRWVTYTRRDWTDYLAARTSERDKLVRNE